jgi:hypothetical protein
MPTRLSTELYRQSQQAPFIFSGRIQKIHANNLQGIAPESNHALVKIETVLVSPANLGNLKGRVVTVVLASPAKAGSLNIFWATSWVYDREIGVIEIARAAATKLMAAVGEVVDARLRALDERILDRIRDSDLVVAGTVIDVEELGVDAIAEGTTWRRALVRVSVAIKGNAGADVVIQFPGAGSPRWALAPRLVLGEEGIWILRRPSREPRMRLVKADGAWTALDPNDAHALSSLPRIEALIRASDLKISLGNR